MKKQKEIYRLLRYEGQALHARREIPYEIQLSTQLLLDELCFNYNKDMLEKAINLSIDTNDKEAFLELSEEFKRYSKI